MRLTLGTRAVWRLLGFLGVAAFACWCLFALRADLQQVSLAPVVRSWQVILIAMSMSIAAYFFRAVRWHWYLARLGHRLAPGFSGLTYVAGFAFTLSPGKLGEVVRAQYYARVGVPFHHVAAAVLVERLMDLFGISILAVLIVAALPNYGRVLWIGLLVAAVGLSLLVLIPVRTRAHRFTSRRLPAAVLRAANGALATLDDARALLSVQAIGGALVLGLFAWGLEGLAFGVISTMVSQIQLEPMLALGIYSVALLVGALSLLPGGLGSTEAVMSALLIANGYHAADALLITIVSRFTTLWLAVCLGWIAIATLRLGRLR